MNFICMRSNKQEGETCDEKWYFKRTGLSGTDGTCCRAVFAWLEREHGKQIYVRCYQAKKARGVVLISHGFTETSEKYKELIYYFLRGGYHVYIPEHCGHGRSYRLVEDPSLVHVDSYKRYVADLLFVARTAKKEHKNLKLYLFGHSMGGGIAAVAAKPKLFERLVLSSPMIRPLSGKVPWHDARTIATAFCKAGQAKR